MITNSNLHYFIIKGIIDNGFAPEVEELAEILKANNEEIIKGLYNLQEYHGVASSKPPKGLGNSSFFFSAN